MRTRSLAVVGLVAALTLSACSDDSPEPRFEPESSSAAATTTPSSPTTEASETEPVGRTPVATVRAWFAALSMAMESGDLSAVKDLTSPRCETCNEQIDAVSGVYEAGGHYQPDGVGWQVVRAKRGSSTASEAQVTVALKLAAGTTVPSEGADPISYPVEHRIAELKLILTDGRWLVSFIGFLS